MNYLLDTCVISELVVKRPSQKVIDWIDGIDSNSVYLSVITIGEIQQGIEKVESSERRLSLQQWVDEELLYRFENRILLIDIPVMREWGQMVARLQKEGCPMPAVDSMIAALAIHHRMVLVTRNEKDFIHSGALLLNPWNP